MIGTLLKWILAIGLFHAALPSSGPAQAQDESSPRAYCRTSGGVVSESGSPQIFICCYASKHKCILCNEQHRYSRVVSVASDVQKLQLAREHAANARRE